MYDTQNPFAKILRGEWACHKLYEDELCLAFMDIMPVNPGHLLVIPKAPVSSMDEVEEDLAAHLMKIAVRLSKALKKSGLPCEGQNFWISDGPAGGQEVPHVHLHVIPRFVGDGFGWKVGPHNRLKASPEDLASWAEKIKGAL